eukprot:TRINITY_DN36478_c0_g1_i1.p1 TRINITY_DN36478_c0_g1~~TRINITY_DN36478_c0_g1_i1.p1  ORF type:complete len:1022 (-),score=193.83 TRINITY_DN36478_c0_g1_i1:77-3004(-)
MLPSLLRRSQMPPRDPTLSPKSDGNPDFVISPTALEEGGASSGRRLQKIMAVRGRSGTGSMSHQSLDLPKIFLEDFLHGADELDDRLDRLELEKARAKLLAAMQGVPEIQGGASEEMNAVMIYKGRPLRAQLLHFAVWVSATLHESSCVERVLPYLSNEELFGKAKYQTRPGANDETWLDAIHIAAGLGAIPALEVLLHHVVEVVAAKDKTSYVNTECVIYHVEQKPTPWFEYFHTPLHDATYAGNKEVSRWLLKHHADARAKNKDGVTPLHFVAMRSINGGLEAEEELGRLVKALRAGGASLEAKIPMQHPDPMLRGKTPMQLAAADESRFPKRMLHFLAPSLHNRKRFEPCFFSDVLFVAKLNEEAAEEVVRELVCRAPRHPEVLHSFRFDAQMPGRTDMMAAILYIAPFAAGEMLDMLIVEPEVQDVGKHNVPTRTSLWGFFTYPPMRCIYRPDVITRDSVMLPAWKFDSQKDVSQQPSISWHDDFMPRYSKSRSSRDHVADVSVKAMLLPNMLDIDIFMALSQVENDGIAVFSKLSVQGIIYCLWDNLIQHAWALNMVMHGLELVAYIWWGLSGHGYEDPKWLLPVCWLLVTAGGLREIMHLGVLVKNWMTKWREHDTKAVMTSMWHPMSWLFTGWCVPTLVQSLLQLAFSLGTEGHSLSEDRMSQADRLLMALCVLMKCWLIIYMNRLCASGVRIHAITNSLMGGATRQMMVITSMIFGSFSAAFIILDQHKSIGWVLFSAYRGLLFGDGSGLDNLGLNVGESMYAKNDGMLAVVTLLGSVFFNIIILNLIIAVYGNEYDKVQRETPLLFLHARAKYCVMFFFSCNMFPWKGAGWNAVLALSGLGTIALAICLHLFAPYCRFWPAAVLLALGQVLMSAAAVQCDWFSNEGMAASQEDHFVWICHRSDFHEHSMSEMGAHNSDQSLDERLSELKEKVEERFSTVERKVAGFDEKLDLILDKLQNCKLSDTK